MQLNILVELGYGHIYVSIAKQNHEGMEDDLLF